jgi:hypothetical protein
MYEYSLEREFSKILDLGLQVLSRDGIFRA